LSRLSRDLPTELLKSFRAVVGDAHLIEDPETKAGFERDITGRFTGSASVVLRPADTQQVSRIVAACGAAGVPVVAQGGNTGLVGGAVPVAGEVVISLQRLRALGVVDELGAQVSVGAGTTLEELQRHAISAGLRFPVDHGARSTATIGGMVATNAGGPLALRHGTMRRQVVGVEVVVGDGRVLSRMGGLVKDNAGYDLTSLIVGSEGTLGIVTAARLQLARSESFHVTALLGLDSTAAGVEVVSAVRRRLGSLEAADFFKDTGMEMVCAHRGVSRPFARRHDTYVVLELASDADPTEALAQAMEPFNGLVDDVAVATDSTRRLALWGFRDSHNEAVNAAGVPLKLDVSVAPSDVPGFEAALRRLLDHRWPELTLVLYGHLGDGNIHVNIIGVSGSRTPIEDAILGLVGQWGGSISAEHGVGLAKVPWLSYTRSPVEVALMQSIKQTFDRHEILGRGRIFPPTRDDGGTQRLDRNRSRAPLTDPRVCAGSETE
jgi:FAD/FMN-containing dehydrogenase